MLCIISQSAKRPGDEVGLVRELDYFVPVASFNPIVSTRMSPISTDEGHAARNLSGLAASKTRHVLASGNQPLGYLATEPCRPAKNECACHDAQLIATVNRKSEGFALSAEHVRDCHDARWQ
jgi:hypothetical protein